MRLPPALVILLPFFLSLLFLPLMDFQPPGRTVFIRATVSKNISLQETWLMAPGDVRTLPGGAGLLEVDCPGQAFVAYDGRQHISCDYNQTFTLTVKYSLPRGSWQLYSGPPVRVSYDIDALNYSVFPAAYGRAIFLASPYDGRYEEWSAREERWFYSLYLALSLEVFLAFLLYLYAIRKNSVPAGGLVREPPVPRSPHELASFLPARREAVLNAEALWLAAHGFLDISRDAITIIARPARGFARQLVEALDYFAHRGKILLDRDWLAVRRAERGAAFRRKLAGLKFPDRKEYDCFPWQLFVAGQLALTFSALLSYIRTPMFLHLYRQSLLIFSFVNLFWLFIAFSSRAFCLYSEGTRRELAGWKGYRRFVETPSELRRHDGDWLYPLVFAALIDSDGPARTIIERGIRLRNIQDPRIALFDLIE